MTTNHIDQLAEWWESAEDAPASPGDRIIERHVCERDEDTYYTIGVHREGMRGLIGKSGTRILARAPKPKPAWHDAVAVMADDGDGGRMVWVRVDEQGKAWESADGFIRHPSDLNSPTPLIEAKVTDEARDRVWRELVHYNLIDPDKHRPSDPWTADVVHVALGLETE